MPELSPARLYRFGVFEADPSTGELRRQGLRIKLHAQPFQVLTLLLERPGELLTREEISRTLWPEGTYVDYEHGVNSAVNRIREALRDTAANPRYLETMPRRGYRFIAPVERISAEESPVVGEEISVASNHLAAADLNSASGAAPSLSLESTTLLATEEDLPRTPYRTVQLLFLGLQLMYLGFYVGALANLPELSDLFTALPNPTLALDVLVVTAALMIAVRAWVMNAAIFHAPGFREKYLRVWPLILMMDALWSLAPFLLLHHMSFGLALACTPLLVYSPFAQRSLILMGAGRRQLTNL